MPDPTREQFDAAAKKVMETAPASLSRDAFYALIDKELARADSGVKPATAFDMASGRVGRDSNITDTLPEKKSGGFLQSAAQNPMLQAMAHPQTAGDMLGLLIPAGVEGAVSGLKGFTSAVRRAATDAPSVRSMPGRILGTLWKDAKQPVVQPLDWLPEHLTAQHDFNKLSRAEQLERMTNEVPIPESTSSTKFSNDRSAPPPYRQSATPPTPFNERPLYQQMEEMSNVGPTPNGRQGMPVPAHKSPPMSTTAPPRLAGKAPTVEQALEDALQRARGSEPPTHISSAPEPTMTDGGATRQSGKFGKSQSLGQPGGYSSGRPSTPQTTELQDLIDRLRGSGAETDDLVERAAAPSTPTPMHSTEPSEWHSGAEAGSADAQSARSLHNYEGEMNAGYTRRLADDKGESTLDVLSKLGLLGGASVSADAIRRLIGEQE